MGDRQYGIDPKRLAEYAQEIAGSTPPVITGTDAETTENVEDSIEEEDKV